MVVARGAVVLTKAPDVQCGKFDKSRNGVFCSPLAENCRISIFIYTGKVGRNGPREKEYFL